MEHITSSGATRQVFKNSNSYWTPRYGSYFILGLGFIVPTCSIIVFTTNPVGLSFTAARRLIMITLYTLTLPQSDGCRSVLFWGQDCRGEVRYRHMNPMHSMFFFGGEGGGEAVAKPEVITA